MNSAIDLRPSRALELLRRLQETAATIARREEKLALDLRNRRQAAGRKHRETLEKMEARAAAQIAEVEAAAAAETERVSTFYHERSERIQRLVSTAARSLPKRARDAKERWMGDLQMRHLRAERNRASGLSAAERAMAQAAADLRQHESQFALLERRCRRDFAGFPKFLGLLRLSSSATHQPAETPEEFAAILERLAAMEALAGERLRAFHAFLLPRFFSYLPPEVLVPLVAVGALVVALALGFSQTAWLAAGGAAAAGLAVLAGIYFTAQGQSAAVASELAAAMAELRALHAAGSASVAALHESEKQRVQEEFDAAQAEIQEQWGRAETIESDFEHAARAKLERQVPRIADRVERLAPPRLERLAADCARTVADLRRAADERKQRVVETHAADCAALEAEETAAWASLVHDWQSSIQPLYRELTEMCEEASYIAPFWDAAFVERWKPPVQFTPAAKFASMELDLAAAPGGLPKDPRLALPGPPQVAAPLALTFPDRGSLLFETHDASGSTVADTVSNIILRLLSAMPPGKAGFTIIDPVGLGQNFAGLMHLADYEETLINRRIWTQRDQIEERLAELSEHIEKVIQMYLRNEYATITEYNAQAGSVAEKYQFLVVADFPANFSESAAKRLQSIAVSGPRCGVFTLLHWDARQPLPDGFVPDDLRKNSLCITGRKGSFTLAGESVPEGAVLRFDPPPAAEVAAALVHRIGKSSIDSNRVEVPFAQIAPEPGELWTHDTTNELKIAIGRTGATKLQYLAIGKGTRQHALFAGKTGSGKSTLFHVIITNLALACSPEQVEFYLIDFKKGVEFKCYASQRLPHARVVAIESDREFALSVLQRVDEELKRRGDLFRKLEVQDLAGYKKAGGTEPMPRSLLLIDEFQEFFVDDDAIAQTASLLFDRIVRQGRAFGIHVLLGSQSLGGAYSLARATIGQMVIRVALQCNEADAYLIMDDSNAAPRLLSRPGEGIYNDAGGALEGNSPFQVVWLSDEERDQWLAKVRELAMQRSERPASPIVFEGNAPANVRENDLLQCALETAPTSSPTTARAWLGAPNAIKGPTEATFRRQSGNHLLIVGQREEAALSMLGLGMLALAAQFPKDGAKFILLNGAAPDAADGIFIDRVLAAMPQPVTVVRGQEVASALNEAAAELKARQAGAAEGAAPPPLFVFIYGLQKFKKLRQEDDFSFSISDEAAANPAAQFGELITEGSSHGIHLLVTVDTFNNVNRFINRKALSEFEMRVVFQMSANDSASLIDSPQASGLGLHRAIFYHEHAGTLETFRPYALPDNAWLEETAEKLRRTP